MAIHCANRCSGCAAGLAAERALSGSRRKRYIEEPGEQSRMIRGEEQLRFTRTGRLAWRVLLLGALATASGCTLAPRMDRPPVEERGTRSGSTLPGQPSPGVDSRIYQPEPSSPAESRGAIVSSPAVRALLAQAEQDRLAVRFPQAISALERAQRIAPRDPAVYVALAELKIAMGDYTQAAQLARKGLALKPGPAQRGRLEALVAEGTRKAALAP